MNVGAQARCAPLRGRDKIAPLRIRLPMGFRIASSVVSPKFITYCCDLAEDGIGRGGPAERLRAGIMTVDVVEDSFLEVGYAGEGTAANRLVGDQGKAALYLVQPARMGRDEMQRPVGPRAQPADNGRGLVGGVVVDDQVDLEAGGHLPFDLAQKSQKLAAAVPGFEAADDPSGGDVQRREQRGGAMAEIVVTLAFGMA